MRGRRATRGNNGELQTKTSPAGTTQYLYNGRGHLRSVSLPDGRVIEHKHEADGICVLKQLDHEPLAWRTFRESHATEHEQTAGELEVTGSLGVVDQRRREHGGGPEPERVPALRTRHDERGAVSSKWSTTSAG